jgi:type VI secretion system protein ImpF
MSSKGPDMNRSILDRLIDVPGTGHESAPGRSSSWPQIKAAVRRDLENLLNTKNFSSSLFPTDAEIQTSLLSYGLPDFTALNPQSSSVTNQVRQSIERAIGRFEPRLRNVTVRFDNSVKNERNLRFKISALLVVDPVAERVTFDTLLDVNRSQYSVVE